MSVPLDKIVTIVDALTGTKETGVGSVSVASAGSIGANGPEVCIVTVCESDLVKGIGID